MNTINNDAEKYKKHTKHKGLYATRNLNYQNQYYRINISACFNYI